MKVFLVQDHICEADIPVAVFSRKAKARSFVRRAKKQLYPNSKMLRYEGLDIVEFELDKEP